MTTLTIPNTIQDGITADGNDLGANFAAIKAWADVESAALDAVEAAPGANMTITVLERTTDMSLPDDAVQYEVTWENETDPDGWWSSGTTITVPSSGIYAFTVEGQWDSGGGDGSTGAMYVRQIAGGGQLVEAYQSAITDPTNRRCSGGNVLTLRAAQTFEVTVTNIGGGGGAGGGGSAVVAENVKLTIVKLA